MRLCKSSTLIILLSVFFTYEGAAKPLALDQQNYIKSVLSNQLLDPDSAKYKFPDYIEGNSTYCFKLNATNTYGGYTGYRWVQIAYNSVAQKKNDAVVDINVLPKEVFEESCKELGYK
ncbi:hypothetical protein GR78_19095 [Salmonella enterica]|nr:hypothetical protein [Salmonella enterica]